MTKKISFAVENIEELQENPNSSFAHMKVDFFASGNNAHNLYVSEDTLKKTAKTIYNVPVVWKYDSRTDDALSHEEDEYPCGVVKEGSVIEEKRLADGRLMLSVPTLIWKKYSGRLMEIFKRDKKKAVSVEMSVLDASEENGKQELLDYRFEAITILGKYITPAIPMAEMTVLSFAEEMKEFQEAYEKEFSYDKYSSVDFTIPETMKNAMQKAIEKFEKLGKGGNSVSLSNAKYVLKNEKITPDRIRKMYKKLSFYSQKPLEEDDEKVRFELWGGSSFSWIKETYEKMKEIDEKKSTFFVYKNISEANPAIRGIDPPVTVSQANAIARQAEAIGSDEEKNGWAIAISGFKKTHKVEDGKWVKKESSFAKEDLGKSESIDIDKDKDSMVESSWGNVDKTALMHKVLGAKNYKELVDTVYAKVDDGWEDHPSSSLHYPIMQISEGKAVYNRYGLSQALLRAEAQNESGVISKIKKIYEKMGLDEPGEKNRKEEMSVKTKEEIEKFSMEAFSLNSSQIIEILNNSLSEFKYGESEYRKYWVESFDSEMAYVYDNEDGKCYGIPYSIADNVAKADEGQRKEVVHGSYVVISPRESQPGSYAEGSEPPPTDSEPKTEMSLDSYLDLPYILKLLEEITEGEESQLEQDTFAMKCAVDEIKKEEGEKSFESISKGMFAKMKLMASKLERMAEENKAYMSMKEEFDSLKSFKESVETSKLAFEVETTLNDVEGIMPKEEVNKAREEAKNFSLDRIEEWKNGVKAKAFTFSTGKHKDVKKEVPRWGFNIETTNNSKKELWEIK